MSVVPVKSAQTYADGFSEGYSWRVDDITHGTVHLTLLHEGVETEGRMQWPFNRWFALVEKQGLVLDERDGMPPTHGKQS